MYRLSAICHFALEGCLRSSGLLIPRRGFNTALAGAPRTTKWRRRAGSRGGVAEPAGAARARRQEGVPRARPRQGSCPAGPAVPRGRAPRARVGGAPTPLPGERPRPPAPPLCPHLRLVRRPAAPRCPVSSTGEGLFGFINLSLTKAVLPANGPAGPALDVP